MWSCLPIVPPGSTKSTDNVGITTVITANTLFRARMRKNKE